MNEDQFEERLRRQPPREVPAGWRNEILSAARAAGSQPSALDAQPAFLSTLNHQLSTIFQPYPKAWAGLAAMWLVILALQLSSRDREPVVAQKAPPPSPEVLMVLRQQKLLMAELIERPEPRAVDRPKTVTPQPRSSRSQKSFNA